MDWLTNLTQWLKDQLLALWDAFITFMGDLLVMLVDTICTLFALAFEAIPVPDFLTTYSLNTLFGQAGPTVAWLVGTFRIGEGLLIIAAGFAFRLLRKALTLGQW